MKCNTCDDEIRSDCDYRQGRCPHQPPLINLEKLKMNIQPRDTSLGHFYVSLVKSVIRIGAGIALVMGMLAIAGGLFIVAEFLGMLEEVV
jgi:hypothetical protein